MIGRALVLSVLMLVACHEGASIQHAMNSYHQRRYADARLAFEQLEGEESVMNAKGQVRYLTFRGLTYYRIDERELARKYLWRARHAYDQGERGWLDAHTVTEMNRALEELSGE
jgi:hypothetical protein